MSLSLKTTARKKPESKIHRIFSINSAFFGVIKIPFPAIPPHATLPSSGLIKSPHLSRCGKQVRRYKPHALANSGKHTLGAPILFLDKTMQPNQTPSKNPPLAAG